MHCTAPLRLNARSCDQTEVLPHSLSVTGSIIIASVRTDGTAVNVHVWGTCLGYMYAVYVWGSLLAWVRDGDSASEVDDIRPGRSQAWYGAEI